MRILSALIALVTTAGSLCAQDCPKQNPTGPTLPSASHTLRGRLIYHDGIRQWFELKLAAPLCGQSSLEEVGVGSNEAYNRSWRELEHLRGCEVDATGPLDFAPTGYYSLDVYQAADHIAAAGECIRKPALPTFARYKPSPNVRRYRVDMYVNYRGGDHPIKFKVTADGFQLRPWQAYASYTLTGGFALYGSCGEGFAVSRVFGTPQAHPTDFGDGNASFDPETAAAAGVRDLKLGYVCVRAK